MAKSRGKGGVEGTVRPSWFSAAAGGLMLVAIGGVVGATVLFGPDEEEVVPVEERPVEEPLPAPAAMPILRSAIDLYRRDWGKLMASGHNH